jgi:hypothetical protein
LAALLAVISTGRDDSNYRVTKSPEIDAERYTVILLTVPRSALLAVISCGGATGPELGGLPVLYGWPGNYLAGAARPTE